MDTPAVAGALLSSTLEGHHQGATLQFSRPFVVAGQEFSQVKILREYHTGSHAMLLQFRPYVGDEDPSSPSSNTGLFVCKYADLQQEHALMCALRAMNRRWSQRGISICGVPVEAVAYDIYPLGTQIGLVRVVQKSWTLCDLASGCPHSERHLRVLRTLCRDPKRLDKLAATTVGYLTMGYALGIRDGHDDNLMLREDGAFFRIDFGFAWGKTPEIDAPTVFVPNSVSTALGKQRWCEVVNVCADALQALSSDDVRTLNLWPGAHAKSGGQPPAWDLLRSVPELVPSIIEARAYTRSLTFEDFNREVQQADQWSMSRAAKNTIREVVRFLSQDDKTEVGSNRVKEWLSILEPSNLPSLVCRTTSANLASPKGALEHRRPLGNAKSMPL